MIREPRRLSSVDLTPERVAQLRDRSVVAVVPTKDESATIEHIVGVLVSLRRSGVLDRVLVADDSADDTPSLAERAGAEVVRQRDLRSDLGPVRGKGDAMWRAGGICPEDVICFVDGDSIGFSPAIPAALVGAVAQEAGVPFAKATYERPFVDVTGRRPTGGGRVTQLTALPLLRQLFPELAHAFSQPLAGELAITRELLGSVPLATGYAVDVALLIDVWRQVGVERMAEVDVGTRQNRHRPLHELQGMADEVVGAILTRAGLGPAKALVERPPLAQRTAA